MTQIQIFPAKRIYAMSVVENHAEAFAVRNGTFLGLGSVEKLRQLAKKQYPDEECIVDDRLLDKVVLPGLIDNHLHPFLGALLLPTEIIAPEAWRDADAKLCPAIRDATSYEKQLRERISLGDDNWFISWGYYPNLHGNYTRKELNRLSPKRPVMLWHRSFHEAVFNDAAIHKLGIDTAQWNAHPQMSLEQGHCWETGMQAVLTALMPVLLQASWYRRGLEALTKQMHRGGITTAADMAFGLVSPAFESNELELAFNRVDKPKTRIVNVFDLRSYSNRASGTRAGPPEAKVDFVAGLGALSTEFGRRDKNIWNSHAVKLFADGAMFSQLMQMRPPGYTDGHLGQWLMSPEVLSDGLAAAWAYGLSVHIHVNGDAGLDAVIAAVKAKGIKPNDTQRLLVHHLGYHAPDQTNELEALGIHASVNPYYVHALADEYSVLGLGPERAKRMVSAGSLLKAGLKISLHSDFSMAPCEPLGLAWCAANRVSVSGKVYGESERLTLDQALRAITIDAAWAIGLEKELGSIEPGKVADWCVLDQDPDDLGVEGLNKLTVRGTALAGELSLFDEAQESMLAHACINKPQTTNAPKPVMLDTYRRLRAPSASTGCNSEADACDFLPVLARVFQTFHFKTQLA